MKNFLAILILSLFCFNLLLSKERSKEEIQIGVFLEDLKDIGQFEKIEKKGKNGQYAHWRMVVT